MRQNVQRYDAIFFAGRLSNVLLALVLGFYIFRWTRQLYGTSGGLVSLLLYVFSPNILAHARLVTTDLGCTLFMFVATYYFWHLFWSGNGKTTVWAGISTGLALLTKFTGALLFPIYLSLWLLSLRCSPKRLSQDNSGTVKAGVKAGARHLFIIVMISVVVINVGYGFKETLRPLATIPHESQLFETIDRSPLNLIPIPLPAQYIQGFDRQKLDAEKGVFLNYLRGELYTQGRWYYFLYAFAVKTPIVFQVVLLLALCRLLGRIFSQRDGFRTATKVGTDGALLLPVVIILSVFSLANEINVGIRYILPLFPFLFVWAGSIVPVALKTRFLRLAGATLLVAYVATSLSVFPHYLSFFNAWAGGPEKGHQHLLDSNLDWGQDLKGLGNYMKNEEMAEIGLAYFGHVDPAIYGIDYHVVGDKREGGPIAVSANYLYGLPYLITYTPEPVPIRPHTFTWLHDFEPVDSIGHSILVFSIPE
jgi:4-amino-4-deoxy-L-arabinose transferase-like glycosyltransferase